MLSLSRLLLAVMLLVSLQLQAQDWSYEPYSLEGLIERYHFYPSDVGILLFDPKTATPIFEYQSDQPRIPASTTKAASMIAALEVLGPSHRFATTLLATGRMDPPNLYGNIYLLGGGDPSLSGDDLMDFIYALERAGIRRVVGSFVYDDSLLPLLPEIDPRQPETVDYNPGISALSVNYNRIVLRWQHSRGSSNFIADIYSPAATVNIPVNSVRIGANYDDYSGSRIIYDGSLSTDRWLLSPKLRPRGGTELPVKADVGLFTATLFQTLCQQHDIVLPPPRSGRITRDAEVVHTHYSPPLTEIVAKVLRYSNNLAAEMVGLATTRKLAKRTLLLRQSAQVQSDWYRSKLPRTGWRGYYAANHSGLSNETRHTPRQLASILQFGWNQSTSAADFYRLLPAVAWQRYQDPVNATVRAKSGTMNYADGLAGFLSANSGRQLGFVILLTDMAKRTRFDANFNPHRPINPPDAKNWTHRAKAFERALVESWQSRY